MKASRRRRALVVGAVIFFVMTVLAVTLVWRGRGTVLHKVLSKQANSYLRHHLGSEASVEDFHIGFHTITISGLSLPMDQHGSRLVVSKAVARFRLLDIVTSPGEIARSLRELDLRGVDLEIETLDSRPSGAAKSPLTEMKIPPTLYGTLVRLDSLTAIRVEQGRVWYGNDAVRLEIARDVSLSLNREDSREFSLSGSGRYLADDRNTFSLSGTLIPNRQSLSVSAFVDIPSGTAAWLDRHLDGIQTGGGSVSFALRAQGAVGAISLTGAVNEIRLPIGDESVRVPRLRVESNGDTLSVDPFEILFPYGEALMRGQIKLSPGDVNLTGYGQVWQGDTASVELSVCGDLRQPSLVFSIPAWDFSGQKFTDISGELVYRDGALEATELKLSNRYGHALFGGRIQLDSTLDWSVHGSFDLDSTLVTGGWRPRFVKALVDVQGRSEDFTPKLVFLDSSGVRLADVSLQRSAPLWIVRLEDPTEASSMLEWVSLPDRSQIRFENGQVALHALFAAPDDAFEPLRALSLAYEGTRHSGQVVLNTEFAPDSTRLLPQIFRKLTFSGSYRRSASDVLDLNGEWSGLNGEGEPFHGSGEVSLKHKVLNIGHLFVDEAGTATGSIDFGQDSLDVEFDVDNVPFDRLPVLTTYTKRARIMGSSSGHFAVFGSLTNPEWSARMSVAEGSVLGVPGYWINLDAAGQGSHMNLHQLEVGRDIQRIFVADGWLDVGQNEIAVTAETGSARAEDFILAATGRTGILSGTLGGRAAITGLLTRPNAEVEARVTNGKIANEIHFTTMDLVMQVSVPSDGVPVIRISELELGERGKYFFTGHLESGVRAGSPLKGHVEGGGDLLNLVDQLDRSFHSSDGSGNVSFDIGGTINHPVILGGSLSIDRGRFSYTPATPITLDLRVAINMGSSGRLESGTISMTDGNQWLSMSGGTVISAAYPALRPIIIPGLGTDLGVLEIRTGTNGIPVRVPGLMKPEWVGTLTSGTPTLDAVTVSLQSDTSLLFKGDVGIENARMTFPFIGGGSGPMPPVTRWLVERLSEGRWELNVHVGTGNHYDVEITGLRNSDLFSSLRDSPIFSTIADYLDHLSIDAVVDPADAPLEVRATIADSSFYLNGRLSSTHGRVEYLDQQFRVDYAYCDFDETNIMPVLEGRASTYGLDSLGRQVPVYLTMYVIDRETQIRQKRGRLDDLTFVLEDDSGDPPEDVLALLGYDLGDVGSKAQQVVTLSLVRALGRQWLDPIERRLERWTPLDEVTISPTGGTSSSVARLQRQRASKEAQQSNQDLQQTNGVVRFFTGSQVTVGKYFTNDVFVTYTGELAEDATAPQGGRLSLIHLWNLEYRIKPITPDLVVDFAVEYDEIERKRDESVSLKYSFALEP